MQLEHNQRKALQLEARPTHSCWTNLALGCHFSNTPSLSTVQIAAGSESPNAHSHVPVSICNRDLAAGNLPFEETMELTWPRFRRSEGKGRALAENNADKDSNITALEARLARD